MLKKSYLVGGSILGTFLLVYGTAIIFRLLMGNYFMDGGLTDPAYIYLALLCALPFVAASLMGRTKDPKKHIETIVMGGGLFLLLFMTVHGVLVFSAIEMTASVIERTLLVFPVSALLVVFAAYIGKNMGRTAHKQGLD